MQSKKTGFHSIEEYIASFPEPIRKILEELRATIKASAPDAVEKIRYQMPAFVLEGNLVWFAALKNHIGFYPMPSGIRAFQRELSLYKSTKGAIRFPIDYPLPLALIRRIVRFRVAENIQKAGLKAKKGDISIEA